MIAPDQSLHHSKRGLEIADKANRLRTPKEAAVFFGCSISFLAKARMRGDGPPYIKIGRNIRYSEAVLLQWMKAHQHLSTSEQ